MYRKFISSVVLFTFTTLCVLPPGYAQSVPTLNLPTPGTMVHLSQPFVPVLLKGMTLHPDDPFRFDFILDQGHTKLSADQLRQESDKLVKYFLASMTVPKNDLWVNLSPNEPNRIITSELSKTQLGRDLLAQDYILKQLTATLMNPEEELGAAFWKKVHEEAKTKFNTDNIPTNTFNKVWVMPESATVYEHENTVYIVESKLKVMLDEDYVSLRGSEATKQSKTEIASPAARNDNATYIQIMKEIILPAIEQEVNNGANFAPLRQIYHSLILAKWYKDTVKNSLLSKVYIDQNKVSGVDDVDEKTKNEIYDQYMNAYQKGVYSIMKEEYDAVNQSVIPRQYFSGGFKDYAMTMTPTDNAQLVERAKVGDMASLSVNMRPQGSDTAMLGLRWILLRYKGDELNVALEAYLFKQNEDFLIKLLDHTNNIVRTNSAKTLIKKNTYEHLDILKRLLDRQPSNAKGNIFSYLQQAIQYKKEGFDFTVLYTPESTVEIDSGVYPHWDATYEASGFKTTNVIKEALKISRGEKFDSAQLADIAPILAGVGRDYQLNLAVIDQVTKFATENPIITSLGVVAVGIAGLAVAYQIWSKHTVSGNYRRLYKYWDEETLIPAINFLGESKTNNTNVIEKLFSLLHHNNEHVRLIADIALKKLGITREQRIDGYIKAYWFGNQGAQKDAIDSLMNENYEHIDILKKLKERQPRTKGSSLLDFLDLAIQYKLEGFDFNVIFQPEKGHSEETGEDNMTNFPTLKYTVVSEEILNITRGKKLDKTKPAEISGNRVTKTAINDPVQTNPDFEKMDFETLINLFNRNEGSYKTRNRIIEALVKLKDARANPYLFEALVKSIHLNPETEILDALEKLGASKKDLIAAYIIEIKYATWQWKISLAEKIISLGGYEHQDVLQRLLERQPQANYTINHLLSFLDDAIQLKLSGYDFEVLENWETSSNDGTLETQIDKLEVSIKRGKKLDHAQLSDVGGIDMNTINIDRQGKGMTIEFDPQAVDPLLNDQIRGFVPVIINITPLPSVMPLLGLEPKAREKAIELSGV